VGRRKGGKGREEAQRAGEIIAGERKECGPYLREEGGVKRCKGTVVTR